MKLKQKLKDKKARVQVAPHEKFFFKKTQELIFYTIFFFLSLFLMEKILILLVKLINKT
jgi:hypothetical protein